MEGRVGEEMAKVMEKECSERWEESRREGGSWRSVKGDLGGCCGHRCPVSIKDHGDDCDTGIGGQEWKHCRRGGHGDPERVVNRRMGNARLEWVEERVGGSETEAT